MEKETILQGGIVQGGVVSREVKEPEQEKKKL